MMNFATRILSSLKCLLGICPLHYLFLTHSCLCACVLSAQTCFPVSQESARCVKSPGGQRAPTDDPDMIPETVSSPFPYCTADWNWIMGLSLICWLGSGNSNVAAKHALWFGSIYRAVQSCVYPTHSVHSRWFVSHPACIDGFIWTRIFGLD